MARRSIILLVLFSALIMSGCAGKQVARCTAPEDNPQHHYLRGMEALEGGKLDTAKEKFDRAVYCNEKYPPAYGGLAIVSAEKAKTISDPAMRNVEASRAMESLKRSEKLSESDEEKFIHQLAVIRVMTALQPKDWLSECESAYRKTKDLKVDERKLLYYQGTEAVHYFLGLAYLQAKEFQQARDKFRDTLDAKREGKWHEKADKAWKKCDKIVRAMAGITVGDVGKQIAVKDEVTRADLAALLIDELKIDKLFAGRIPVQSEIDKKKPEFIPADIAGSPFNEEILTILKWKVRGLEPKYDETSKAYLFKPADSVLRGEMAFILEDVLIKLTGDEKLATAYFGAEKSPFPDVKPTSLYYNAVMNMTTRGIMEGELSGEFRVNAPVDGAEALLAIRVLRQKMNIY